MSNIEKLLKGVEVEWKTLGEVTNVLRGKRLTRNLLSTSDKYPVFHGGLEPLGYYYNPNRPADTVMIINVGASAGTVGYSSVDFWSSDGTYCIERIDELNNKFLYYFLLGEQHFLKSRVRVAGIPTLDAFVIEKLQIPILCPNNLVKSLEIQQEIVRILDKFSTLTAELQAELQARKSQYEYYRNQLLTYPMEESDQPSLRSSRSATSIQNSNNLTQPLSTSNPHTGNSVLQPRGKVKWKTLDSIAENLDSMRKPVTSSSRETGDIPYYGASGIVDYVKDFIFDGDFLLISEDGANLVARNTPIAFSISGRSWVNNHAHVLKFRTYAERRFVEYYLNSIDLTPHISGAAQPKLNQRNLNSIKIPVPSLEEQERIVSILDKFNTLTTSVTEGLPKEIELRQKQYEYYRDMLLTFPTDNINA